MLDLNKNIINSEGAIIFDKYIIYHQERSDEYGLDYTILDNNLKEVDGGVYCYGDYNEKTEMYDICNNTEVVTLKEFFEYINEDSCDYNFNEFGIEITNNDIMSVIRSCC